MKYINNSASQTAKTNSKNKTNLIKKWSKGLNTHLSKEHIQMVSKYINVRVHNIPNHQRSGNQTYNELLTLNLLEQLLQKGKRDVDKDIGKNEFWYTVDGNVN